MLAHKRMEVHKVAKDFDSSYVPTQLQRSPGASEEMICSWVVWTVVVLRKLNATRG